MTERIRIRFVAVTAGEAFFEPVKRGIGDAARLLDVDAEFTGSKGVDAEEMAGLVRSAVADGYHGVAIALFDADAFRPAIAEAAAKGVPVVAFNMNDGNGSAGNLSGISQDFCSAGRSLGRRARQAIPSGAVALITQHDAGISALEQRRDGIVEALAGHVSEWVELVTSHQPETAAARIAEALAIRPEIAAVLCTGQADTEGAGLALAHLGRKVYAAGFDVSPGILEHVQQGAIALTVDQQPYAQGFYPVVQLVLNIRYGLAPANMDAGAVIVDRTNVGQIFALSRQGYR